MNSELGALAFLLIYPRKQLFSTLGSISERISRSNLFDENSKQQLMRFVDSISKESLKVLQSGYIKAFEDKGDTILNLSDAACSQGEEQDVFGKLGQLYRGKGMDVPSAEVPRYLPTVLDFLSSLSKKDATEWLVCAKKPLNQLNTKLTKKKSPWVAVTLALLSVDQS